MQVVVDPPSVKLPTTLFTRRWKKWVAISGAFLLLFVAVWILQHDVMIFVGYPQFTPSLVSNKSVFVQQRLEACQYSMPGALEAATSATPAAAAEEDSFVLSQKWKVLSDSSCIDTSHLDSNVCIRSRDKTVTCLPSFMIIGFEKCATTQLLLWLSYHPSLLGKWTETRFYSTVSSRSMLEEKWRQYLREHLPIPGGLKNVGRYWNFEKTPSSILSPQVANWVHAVTPSARLVVMVRNPTARALSAFTMYTRHINNFNEFSTEWNMKKIMYSSLVIRDEITGRVKFARRGGVGGELATPLQLKTTDRGTGRWRYISYPPSPRDFHDFLLTDQNTSREHGRFHFASRESRVVQGGFYSKYIHEWLQIFPPQRLLLMSMERLWNNETFRNLEVLQEKLGIPSFDFRRVTFFNEASGRHELRSASTVFVGSLFNSGTSSRGMLSESRQMLDDLYCQSNQDLSTLMPSSELRRYSCV